ncbi:MAG: hypothetical protein LBI55_00775 [Oscillospiraceae bacterium]|nr:hypothetical protein [Oscillospiraceae bacterium]
MNLKKILTPKTVVLLFFAFLLLATITVGIYFTIRPEEITTKALSIEDAKVNFGKAVHKQDEVTGEHYCTFPDFTLESPSIISSIQISYPNQENLSGPTRIVAETEIEDYNAGDGTYYVNQWATIGNTVIFDFRNSSLVTDLLRRVKYYCKTSQTINLTISGTTQLNDFKFFDKTGHFYKCFDKYNGISWIEAYNKALTENIFGWKGYLATITSQEENDFIKDNVIRYNVDAAWIGATSTELRNINEPSATHVEGGNIYDGIMYWSCGPELLFTPNDENWKHKGGSVITKKESENGVYDASSINFLNSVFFSKKISNEHHYNYSNWAKEENLVDGNFVNYFGQDGYWRTSLVNQGPNTEYYLVEFGDRLYGNSQDIVLGQSTSFTHEMEYLPSSIQIETLDWYNIPTPTISVTGEANCNLQIKDSNKNLIQETQIGETKNFALTLPKLPDGIHELFASTASQSGVISEEIKFTIKIDTTIPYCKMEIPSNPVADIFNTLFFKKEEATIKVTCSDSLSGIRGGSYIELDLNVSPYDLVNKTGWKKISLNQENPSTGTISVNSSSIVYVKIEDNAGNCSYTRGDNIVVYEESVVTTDEISFFGQDPVSVVINLNGNTINKIQRRDKEILSMGRDYKIFGSIILFNSSYLNTLDNGEHIFDIFCNPSGIVPQNEKDFHKISLKINIMRQIDIENTITALTIISEDDEFYKDTMDKLREKLKNIPANIIIYRADVFDKDGNKIPNGIKLTSDLRIPLPKDFDIKRTRLLTSHLEINDLKGEILKENSDITDLENSEYILLIKEYYSGQYFVILSF